MELDEQLQAAAAAASDAFDAVMGAHGGVGSAPWGSSTCTCGRSFGRQQGLGLHLGAVRRRASVAWDTAYTEALEQ